MTDVQLKFPRLLGLVILFLGVPLMVAVTAILLWLVAVELARGKFDPIVLVLLASIVHLGILIFGTLKDWESLFTAFRVSDSGVQIENRRYSVLFLRWSEIDSALYSKYLKTITLRSSRLQKPLAIISINIQKPSMEFKAAVGLVKRYMVGRYKEKLV
jgi:hypothetical protein